MKQTRSVDKRSNGEAGKTTNVFTRAEHFAEQATDVLSELPKTFKEEIKARPYRTLGIAAAIGVGAGIVLNSRILRSTVATLASVVVAELGRSYLKSAISKEFGAVSFDFKTDATKDEESKAS